MNYLDEIRAENGIDALQSEFRVMLENDRRKAVKLLNDKFLTFPSFFVLMPQIDSLYRYLHFHKLTTLRVIGKLLKKEGYNDGVDYMSRRNRNIYRILRWIVDTGSSVFYTNNEYEKILDLSASVLVNLYGDEEVLPPIVDMMFERNYQGRNIHDLVWIYFRIHDPYALKLIANQLLSERAEDRTLAKKLLRIENDGTEDYQALYQAYLDWVDENDPYLYFTGESMQFSSKPTFCKVDLERKYLGKGTPSYDKLPIAKLDESEKQALAVFQTLDNGDKELLSKLSHKMQRENSEEWQKWIQTSIEEQLSLAKQNEGVMV